MRDGFEVLNLDKLTYAASPSSLAEIAHQPNYHFERGDIADRSFLDRVLGAFKPDAILHFAAETHVDRSITGSDVFVQTNVVGTHALLSAARAYWESLSGDAKDGFRFLHVSTDEVFGALGDTGYFNEETPYDPQSPYAASKAAADHLVRAWGATYKLPVLLANCTNNYGPYQFPEKLIPLATINALEGKPVAVYGAGANVRDWLHVDDHVAALRLILDRAAPGASYMIGGRAERTNLHVVHTICDALDAIAPRAGSRRDLIQFVADRPGHDWRYAADCAKIERELGWNPAHTFEAGLRETVQWYVDRRDWWQPIREGRYQGGRLGLLAEQA
ncbi:dTDP-glucose 4,6-dehydratase [alpha proteobacterium U9-1i]|nr:dTDP-glucose 4,6-dehydratase [alpha proteobacterium U9-1i]